MTTPSTSQYSVAARDACVICGAPTEEVIALPQFPLTGIYIPTSEPLSADESYPKMDQAFCVCPSCGHGQLTYAINPDYLYRDTYTHRTSPSPIATAGNDFFFKHLQSTVLSRQSKFESVLEVGCNDLYLLEKLSAHSRYQTGIDPVLEHLPPTEGPTSSIRTVSALIEEVQLEALDIPRPDLVVSVHTYEHIADPLDSLRKLVSYAADDAIFVIEIPGFDSLLTTHRFDQIFHQHLNYFSVASAQEMIAQLGCHYLSHTFNYKYWLGTLIVAFQKAPTDKFSVSRAQPVEAEEVTLRYRTYRTHLESVRRYINSLTQQDIPLYGMGAAQMLPTLAYQLDSDMAFLQAVFDDNPSRHHHRYPHLAPEILPTDPGALAEGGALITALDSARGIQRRLAELQTRYVVLPAPLI